MLVLILISVLLTISHISCKIGRQQNEESAEQPELEHIDNFLKNIQKQISEGKTKLQDSYTNYTEDIKATEGHHGDAHRPGEDQLGEYELETTTIAAENMRPGYFTIAFEYLLKIIISKTPEDVKALLGDSKDIFNDKLARGNFQWLGLPLTKLVRNIVTAISDLPIDEIRGAMEQFHLEFENRHNQYRPEVNAIFEEANSLIENDDGEKLLEVLINVQSYPNGNMNASQLCAEIIEAFEKPFAKLEGTQQLLHLTNSASDAILHRFPLIERLRRFMRQGEGVSELPERAKKRVAVLSHVDIFLGDIQDKLRQSYNIINEAKDLDLSGNETFFSPEQSSDMAFKKMFEKRIREFGYLGYAWQKLWAQIILKRPEDIHAVVQHSKNIIESMISSGRLEWLGEKLQTKLFSFASAISDLPINALIYSAPGIYTDIKNRQKVYTPQMNEVIDYANKFIEEHDGKHLIAVISEFEEYSVDGEGTHTGEEICQNIIEAFAVPFEKNPERWKVLNKMIKELTEIRMNNIYPRTWDISDLKMERDLRMLRIKPYNIVIPSNHPNSSRQLKNLKQTHPSRKLPISNFRRIPNSNKNVRTHLFHL